MQPDASSRLRHQSDMGLKAAVFVSVALFIFALNSFVKEKKAAVVPFQYHQRLVFVKAKVNAVDSLLFLLDTGANVSAIDGRVARRLNLPITGEGNIEGTAGVISTKSTHLNSLEISSRRVTDLKCTILDLSRMLTPGNQHLDGILGTDAFHQAVVTIDFVNKAMAFEAEESEANANSISFELDNGIPRVPVMINGFVNTFLRY